MTLKKSKKLRKVEIVFTDDQIHSRCHCLYHVKVMEDGVEIMKSNKRETSTIEEIKALIDSSETYIHPEED